MQSTAKSSFLSLYKNAGRGFYSQKKNIFSQSKNKFLDTKRSYWYKILEKRVTYMVYGAKNAKPLAIPFSWTIKISQSIMLLLYLSGHNMMEGILTKNNRLRFPPKPKEAKLKIMGGDFILS